MPRQPERLRDGASILATYEFDVNHHEEEDSGQSRNITRTAPTSGVGFVRQQGISAPFTKKYVGTILRQSQYDAIQAYYEACANRTVFFRDYTGEESEVVIITFSTTRVAVLRNPREPSLMHIWKYRLEMEVIA